MSNDDMFDDDHLDKDDKDDDTYKSSKYDYIPQGIIKKKRNSDVDRPNLKLRACISCRLIMTYEQFYENGCGNCSYLQMDGDNRRVMDCTSNNFNGFISIMDPQKSWSARYNNLNDLIPGCYAISVNGTLPESVKDEINM